MNKLQSIRAGILGGFTLRRYGPFEPSDDPCKAGHEHNIDHLTYIESGSVRCRAKYRDGTEVEGIVRAGSFVLIPAKARHTFWALEPNTVLMCQFAEAEAVKWIEQEEIKKAIELLEKHGEDAKGLRSMLIDQDNKQDATLYTIFKQYAGKARQVDANHPNPANG